MTRLRTSMLLVLALLIAACGSTGDDTTTTAASAVETTVADDATETTAAPDDASETTEAETTEETEAPTADKSGVMSVAVTRHSLKTAGGMAAFDVLRSWGYEVNVVEFIDTATQVQAAVEGSVNINMSSVSSQLAAMDAGWDSKFFLTQYMNPFTLAARTEIAECGDVDGRNVGLHSETDISAALTLPWLEENCPEATPNVIVVPGSPARATGLREGQLDVALLDMQDAQLLMNESPEEYHILADFPTLYPIIGGAYSASPDFLSENAEMVADFVRAHLEVYQEIPDDNERLVEVVERYMPALDPTLIPDATAEFSAAGIWPADGGLSEEAVNETIEFTRQLLELTTIEGYDDVVDPTPLETALGG